MKDYIKIKKEMFCINFHEKYNLHIHEITIPQMRYNTLICETKELAEYAIKYLKNCDNITYAKISKTNKFSTANTFVEVKKIHYYYGIIFDYIKPKKLKTLMK